MWGGLAQPAKKYCFFLQLIYIDTRGETKIIDLRKNNPKKFIIFITFQGYIKCVPGSQMSKYNFLALGHNIFVTLPLILELKLLEKPQNVYKYSLLYHVSKNPQ